MEVEEEKGDEDAEAEEEEAESDEAEEEGETKNLEAEEEEEAENEEVEEEEEGNESAEAGDNAEPEGGGSKKREKRPAESGRALRVGEKAAEEKFAASSAAFGGGIVGHSGLKSE